jgi:hypothetical protein
MSLLVLVLTGTVMVLSSKADGKKDSQEVPATKVVDDQAEAIDEARKVDLPLLEKADKVVIEEMAKPEGKGRRVTLKKADELKEIREALKPSKTPPSGGRTAVALTFSHGENILRKVWVYQSGEWGFNRPGTSWTTGREAALWRAVQKHLK